MGAGKGMGKLGIFPSLWIFVQNQNWRKEVNVSNIK
jgi:hypothetical protein